jgi:hypothetical protein
MADSTPQELANEEAKIAAAKKRSIDLSAQNLKLLNEELVGLTGILNYKKRINLENEIAKEQLSLALEQLGSIKDVTSDEYNSKLKEIELLKRSNKNLEKSNELTTKRLDILGKIGLELNAQLKLQSAWIKGLNDSDKIIRQTILNLGMSGDKADYMRKTFENSAMHVAELGGSLKDIQDVMQGYTDETGRSRVLTGKMVTDVVEIGRGTGLGVENASKMAAQFELMGLDATTVKQMTEKFVNTSEKWGINTTKAIKNVNDNYKRLIQYNFKDGVNGMMKMSQYAEKMNIDMNQALNAVDTARTLNGAIGLAAQLQVMGGEFAKTDPFEMLFLSRNDPEAYAEKINQMTKGIVTFRKNSEGVFQKFISPADRDRLAYVEKALGMGAGELTNQALRMTDIVKMRQNLKGTNVSEDNRKAIEGAAILNSKTGDFEVNIKDHLVSIKDLTEAEANSFIQHDKTLKDRAQISLTFEEALQATLTSFKTILLPMLRGFQTVFGPIVEKLDSFAETLKSFLGDKFLIGLGKFVAGLIFLNVAISKGIQLYNFFKGSQMFKSAGGFGGTVGKTFLPSLFGTKKAVTTVEKDIIGKGVEGTVLSQGKNVASDLAGPELGKWTRMQNQQAARNLTNAEASKLKGIGNLATGAGIGVAAVGVGGGIALAAVGVGQLAKAVKDLDVEKLKMLNWTMVALAVTVAAFTIPLAMMGEALAVASPGLFAFGVTALAIGAGIGVAAAGIGFMGEGLSKLVDSSKNADWGLAKVAVGLMLISGAVATLGVTGLISTLGAGGLLLTLGSIAAFAGPIERVGEAFKEMNLALHGNKEDYMAVENAVKAISNMNVSTGSSFAELVTLLKTPLKVEFADNNVQANITLDIDGERFTSKIIKIPLLANRLANYGKGKTTD